MSSAEVVMRRVRAGNLLGASNAASSDLRRIAPSSGVQPGMPFYPVWDSTRAVREGLKVCSTLAVCLGRIAERAASVPWFVWEQTKSGGAKRRELVRWIEWPRRDGHVSRQNMMEEAHLHAPLNGNALFRVFWEGGPRRRLQPAELDVVNPQGCRPVPHRVRYIDRYEWDDASEHGPKSWDADDIVHVIGRTDPNNRYWGWSIVEALSTTIDADVEARRLNLRRFMRGGTPGSIIIDADVKDDEARRELEESLNRSAQERFGAYMVLGGTQKVEKQDAMTNRQLGLLDAMAHHRDEIAVACDLLPAMFSTDAQTYDNLGHAIRHEWRVAVVRNSRFADAFTKRLVPRADRGRVWYAPWYGEVEELKDLHRQVEDTAILVDKCRVAVNDAIAATGLLVPPQRGGDVALVPANYIPATEASAGL
jgi:phage portal protein BeeE